MINHTASRRISVNVASAVHFRVCRGLTSPPATDCTAAAAAAADDDDDDDDDGTGL